MNLKIVLGAEKLLYLIEKPLGPEPGLEQPVERELWKTHRDDNFTAQSVMLAAMTPQFRRRNKGMDAYSMILKLKDLHKSNLRSQNYELQKKLFRSRMSEGTSVEHFVSQMITDIEHLGQLSITFEAETLIILILQCLPNVKLGSS